jgi:hypothetical protein
MRLTGQLSPDERKIADLKRIVHGCGTIKKWCVDMSHAMSRADDQGQGVRGDDNSEP